MGFALRWIVAVLLLLGGASPAQAQVRTLEVAEATASASGTTPSKWLPVTLPHEWESTFPGHSGEVWYRLQFASPAGPGLQAVYLQRACTNVEVFLNGELVGSGGLMTEPVTRNCYHPQLFQLPRAVLSAQGPNELRIRLVGFSAGEVAARQRAAGLSAVVVGPHAELQSMYDSQFFWNITVAQIIAALIGILGLSMLLLAALRPRDTYLFYFGLFSFGWCLISTRLFVQNVPMSHLQTEILICSAFPPVLACAYLFLMRFAGKRHVWIDRLLWTQVLVVPVVLALAGPGRLLQAASAVYNITAVEFVLTVLYFFRAAWRDRRREFWMLAVVLLFAMVLVAVEIALQNNLLPLPKVHVIHFAMPFIFMVIGLRLIQLFVGALNRAESINVELEHRVMEKSEELERNYEQLTGLRAAQAAQDERRRIASDLHDDLGAKLLTIAQASLQSDGSERIAGMARQALDEMRLSVRGMTADEAPASDVLADWRAETVTRLAQAGFGASWEAEEPPAGLVFPARTHTQLTRILREAVSNAIRHSGGDACRVMLSFEAGAVNLGIEDNGKGLPAESLPGAGGHGLPNIERRVRNLGGRHAFSAGATGGTLLRVSVPLPVQSANMGRL
jgi:two-component system, NarL family, sensor histidine kinase UhpB